MIANKLNRLLHDDAGRISVREMKQLLHPPFRKPMWSVRPYGQKVLLEVVEHDGEKPVHVVEEELEKSVDAINEWRNGEWVRKEIIKRLIEGVDVSSMEEWTIPLQVTYHPPE